MWTVEIDDREVSAVFDRLLAAGEDLRPILQDIGEGIMARTKLRFDTATDPAGVPWALNSPSTIAAFFARGGKVKAGHDFGSFGKKPLQGLTGELARRFQVEVEGNSVTVGSPMIYAGMQQRGGKTTAFPHLWGNIPPREFLPFMWNDELYPQERETLIDELNAWLAGAVEG